jgi:hypothetical protein
MRSVEAETSVARAIEFLSSRVAEEARNDSVPLTELELKQLSFTAETASADEIAAARALDMANDTAEFEAKITRLLFNHDVQLGFTILSACGSGSFGPAPGASPSLRLVSIAVTPADTALLLGTLQQFTAAGAFSDRSVKDIAGPDTWTPSSARQQ